MIKNELLFSLKFYKLQWAKESYTSNRSGEKHVSANFIIRGLDFTLMLFYISAYQN